MKRGRLYTVIFTTGLSCCCAFVLTFANVQWHERIKANKDFTRILATVKALGLWTGSVDRKEVVSTYATCVKPEQKGVMEIFEGYREEKLIGYAMDIAGRGKYGPIKGILVIDPTDTRILSLNIYEQHETPGLGARITSPEWLGQFPGIPLITKGIPGVIISSTEKGPNVVDAVAQASKTMYCIALIINTAITRYLSGGMELIVLNLGPRDAFTGASPPYPSTWPKPPHVREEKIQRPPFMVPLGTRNLALYKPVTSSDPMPIIGELEQITDGIKKSDEFDVVELGPGPQWVQIDLGKECAIQAIVIWHGYKNPIIYNDVIVQIADDKDFTQNVRTLFNNDHDDSSGLGAGKDTAYYARWWAEIVDSSGPTKKGTKARYARVYTNGGVGDKPTQFVEIAVYGSRGYGSRGRT